MNQSDGRPTVALVIDTLGTGGAQEFVYQLSRRLVDEPAFRLMVVSLQSGGSYEIRLRQLGVTVSALAPSLNLLQVPRIIMRLFGLLGASHIRAVHTFLQVSFGLGVPLARLRGKPVFHTIVAVRKQVQKWYFPLMAFYQSWVRLYFTPLPAELRAAWVRPSKITPVGAAIDLGEMFAIEHVRNQVIAPFDLAGAYPVALSIGRLHPDKGHEYALRAWPEVLRAWPSARLLVVGDGDDESRLKGVAEQLSISDSVVFTGFRTDLGALFARADLLLRTAMNEGANFTITQGMAAGLPVVGFAARASSEIIVSERNGLLVPLGDYAALGRAVQRLAADVELCRALGQAGRKDMTTYYDLCGAISVYRSTYLALLGRRQRKQVEMN